MPRQEAEAGGRGRRQRQEAEAGGRRRRQKEEAEGRCKLEHAGASGEGRRQRQEAERVFSFGFPFGSLPPMKTYTVSAACDCTFIYFCSGRPTTHFLLRKHKGRVLGKVIRSKKISTRKCVDDSICVFQSHDMVAEKLLNI